MNELSKGFTGIEINGVRFSNIGEMLRYMDKQREQLINAKEIIKTFLGFAEAFGYSPSMDKFITEAKQFISEVEKWQNKN